MKLLFEFFPIVLFFIAFKFSDIYVATGVAIATTLFQVCWLYLRKEKISGLLWASLLMIVVLGGLTIFLRDPTFIKWKPTVLYWVFSAVLYGSIVFFKKNLIHTLLSSQISLPPPVWAKLNTAWALFFAFMGGANLLVAFYLGLSTETWVSFKLFGSMGLMGVFIVAQSVVLSKYMPEDQNK